MHMCPKEVLPPDRFGSDPECLLDLAINLLTFYGHNSQLFPTVIY